MNIEEIEVFIDDSGEVKYEVRGVKGKKCLDLTKELETDLGGKILLREETSEMYEQEAEQAINSDETIKMEN
ncbi:MAG: DUF2997 domain-containing protein [Deltaproteobacteria bacterium]|nr:DUF2997 domain-containing protein [Deltaproteobacteria bacterium]